MAVGPALEYAQSRELDLVEVAPEADPPVCRVLEYGKWRYEEERSRRASLRNQTHVSSKEIRVRPRIGEHDYRWKRDRAAQFLQARSQGPARRVLPRAGARACRRGATTARAVRRRCAGVRPRRSRHHLRRPKPHDVACAERIAVVTRRRHIHAIAELVVARLDASQPQLSRRLLRPQVRWVAQELDESLARQLGVIDLVERCRRRASGDTRCRPGPRHADRFVAGSRRSAPTECSRHAGAAVARDAVPEHVSAGTGVAAAGSSLPGRLTGPERKLARDYPLPAAAVHDVDRVVLAVRAGDSEEEGEPAPEAEPALLGQRSFENERVSFHLEIPSFTLWNAV